MDPWIYEHPIREEMINGEPHIIVGGILSTDEYPVPLEQYQRWMMSEAAARVTASSVTYEPAASEPQMLEQ